MPPAWARSAGSRNAAVRSIAASADGGGGCGREAAGAREREGRRGGGAHTARERLMREKFASPLAAQSAFQARRGGGTRRTGGGRQPPPRGARVSVSTHPELGSPAQAVHGGSGRRASCQRQALSRRSARWAASLRRGQGGVAAGPAASSPTGTGAQARAEAHADTYREARAAAAASGMSRAPDAADALRTRAHTPGGPPTLSPPLRAGGLFRGGSRARLLGTGTHARAFTRSLG